MKHFLRFLAVTVALLVMCACSESTSEDAPVPPVAEENGTGNPEIGPMQPVPTEFCLSQRQKAVADAQTDFAFRLFGEIADGSANHVASPLSLALALSMAANGADGATLSEIYSALGYAGMRSEDVNTLNFQLSYVLPSLDPKMTLAIANSLWLDKGFPVLDSFKDDNTYWYDAEINDSMTLSSNDARTTINRWVSERTAGLIPELLKKNLAGCCALINTLYFKGEWKHNFDKELTTDANFTAHDGTVAKVPMMHSGCTYPGAKYEDGTMMVFLPYGNGNFVFTAIMPAQGVDPAQFAKTLTAAKWKEISTTVTDHYYLTMPRFKLQSSHSLISPLQALGIYKAFDAAEADFSRLSPKDTYICDVLQESKIIVDETGTEAASGTKIEMADSAVDPSCIETIKLNRPFMFVISESSTGTILFTGAVNKL